MHTSVTNGVKLEKRAIIKFCQQQGNTPTFEKKAATHGRKKVSRTVVFDWHTYFRERNTSITDKKGRGKTKKVTTTLVTFVERFETGTTCGGCKMSPRTV